MTYAFKCINLIHYMLNGCLLFNSLNYMTYVFKCINLIHYILIWAIFDCRYKLDQIEVKLDITSWKEQKRRKEVQINV
jgi:hypothetical protein